MPNALVVQTRSTDRNEYILRPSTGEELDASSVARIEDLRAAQKGACDVQIVVSDGLNALALMEEDQLVPHLDALRKGLGARGLRVEHFPCLLPYGHSFSMKAVVVVTEDQGESIGGSSQP